MLNESLQALQIERLQRVIAKHDKVLTDIPGLTNLVEFDMNLTSAEPVRIRPYPTPFAKEEAEVDFFTE